MNCTKPMIFNTEMVHALLEGRKTVTRRVVKFPIGWNPKFTGYIPDGAVLYGSNNIPAAKAPYQTGDILWVRETWAKSMSGAFMYRADDKAVLIYRWRPSIHMPREAARIFLRVTSVRVERLQDMRLKDCEKEGVQLSFVECADLVMGPIRARERFSAVWDSTIKSADLSAYGWAANPWVWVISFERIDKPADWGCTKS